MSAAADFEIFLAAPPGLEPVLAEEAASLGFNAPTPVAGGVIVTGGWPEVWRANLTLRGAARVLARIGAFRVQHLAQLDKRARKVDWAAVLRPDEPVRVEVTTKRSRIYHSGAAAQRIETAIRETVGAPIAAEAAIRIAARIEDNLCVLSVDCSGEPLHKRGHKQAVGKAPMRETLAALFLRACGYQGAEPVLDPMCGSGTFVIEAAEIAAGLAPGRGRGFAFEKLASFDRRAWEAVRADMSAPAQDPSPLPAPSPPRFYGSDRDAGAIEMADANAERAGVAASTRFERRAVSDLERPDGLPGLVIVNPPYGARIGEKDGLRALHGALGRVLRERFQGWRVGLVTSETDLARATGLPFHRPGPPVPHGPLKIRLFQTDPLS